MSDVLFQLSFDADLHVIGTIQVNAATMAEARELVREAVKSGEVKVTVKVDQIDPFIDNATISIVATSDPT